jgi:hypothetical protein
MRLSFAGAWGEHERKALRELGRLATEQAAGGSMAQPQAVRA